MRKVEDGKKEKKKEKIMLFLMATNVVASRPPNADRLERHTLVPKVRTIKKLQKGHKFIPKPNLA